MRRLRIAVVGAGSIARRYHLPSLARLADEGKPIRLAAMCDLVAERAREASARFGFEKTYTDYRSMLDAEAPDAVWALVPTPAMREVAGFFLSQGVPTMMEKPPGQNSLETRELLDIAETHQSPNQVAFNRRHAPLLRRMSALLTEAGRISALSCQFCRVQRTEPHFAYGTGLHGLDALRFLGDSEVCEVHTRTGGRGSALVTLIYESGAQGIMEMLPQVGVQSERYTGHAAQRTVVVDGLVGWLTLFPGFLRSYDNGKSALFIDNAEDPEPDEVISGFYGESAHFIESLVSGKPPSPDLASSLRSVQIAEAVDRGASVVFS